MPPVQRVLEQLALPRLVRVRRRVHQVQDVAEAIALGRGVVLQQRLAAVETSYGVGDTALDGLRDGAAVTRGPVREQFSGLVRAPEDGVDDLSVRGAVGGTGIEAGLHILGGAHDGGRTEVALASQPAEEACRPGRVGDGEFAHEGREAVVAVVAGLVKGLLGNEVGHGKQEKLGARVALATSAALVRTEHSARGGDSRSGLGLRRLGVESRHGEFPRIHCPLFLGTWVFGGRRSDRWMPEIRERRRTCQMLYPIELHRPEVDDGTRTRNRLVQ